MDKEGVTEDDGGGAVSVAFWRQRMDLNEVAC